MSTSFTRSVWESGGGDSRRLSFTMHMLFSTLLIRHSTWNHLTNLLNFTLLNQTAGLPKQPFMLNLLPFLSHATDFSNGPRPPVAHSQKYDNCNVTLFVLRLEIVQTETCAMYSIWFKNSVRPALNRSTLFFPTYYLKWIFTACNTSVKSHLNSQGSLLILLPRE